MTQPVRPRIPSPSVPTMLLLGIFLILLTAALRLGAGLLLPIAIAGLLTLLLDPPVRALRKLGLSTAVGAALMVFGTLGALVTGGVITGSTVSVVATALTVVFLTYFLLAMLPAFRKKLADLIGTRAGASNVEEVLTEIEVQMSRYLLVNTLTSAGVGLATWALLAGVGLPNALLWGVAAFLLNFIPYAGALVTVALVGAAALVSFDDTGRVLLVVGGCVARVEKLRPLAVLLDS